MCAAVDCAVVNFNSFFPPIVMASKKQKMMLTSWNSALQENPWETTQDDITSIAAAIEATGCTLTTFLTFNNNLRSHLLRSVDSILDRADDILQIIKDLEKPLRDDPIELLNARRLPPSGRKLREVIPLIRHTMFIDTGTLFEARDFRTLMFKTKLEEPISTTTEVDTNFTDFTSVSRTIRIMEAKVTDFGVIESSGTAVLNGHIVSLILGLEKVYPNHHFKYSPEFVVYDNQLQGKNNFVDTSIMYQCRDTLRALIVFEYKSVVHPNPESINIVDLLEAWLYGYYILTKERTIYLCLTDTKVWHYFSVVKQSAKW